MLDSGNQNRSTAIKGGRQQSRISNLHGNELLLCHLYELECCRTLACAEFCNKNITSIQESDEINSWKQRSHVLLVLFYSMKPKMVCKNILGLSGV
jgi:hypothetical protein